MLYKPGDKVMVRNDLINENVYYNISNNTCNTFVYTMNNWKGKMVTIDSIQFNQYKIKEDEEYLWTELMFADINNITLNELQKRLNE